MNKEKLKSFNLKKWGLILLAAFLAIVTALTVSSKLLTDKAISAVQTKEASTKAIIQTEDESFEETLNEDELDYTKIGSGTYIVNYGSSDKASDAVYKTYTDDESVTVNYDTVFETAGIFDDFGITTVHASSVDSKPEDMTWREYADSVGKKLVAVIDTGASSDYASENINFTDEPDADENGHGTSVAKTIIENADEKAIVLSLKALGKDGTGYMSDIMEAVQYAREQQVDIINMSIAAADNGGTTIFKQLIVDTLNDGIQIVAAAGNYNSSAMVYIPANIDGVISVGAMDENNKKLDTSNYAATYYEKADSTSQAAAILTGKLASGKSLDEETKEDDVVIDNTTVEPSFLTMGTTTVKEDDGKQISDTSFDLHISPSIQQKILEHKTHKYIVSSIKLTDYIVNGDEYIDSIYGGYVYAFNSVTDFNTSLANTNQIEPSAIVICSDEIQESEFVAQDTASSDSGTLNGRWNLHLEAEGKNAHVWATATIQSVSGSTMRCGAAYNLVIDGVEVVSVNNPYGTWFVQGTQWSGDRDVTKANVGVSAYVQGYASSYSGGNFSGSTSLTVNSGYIETVNYTVTYQANSGNISKTSDTVTVNPGSSYQVQLPSASRSYYNCTGWYENGTWVGAPGATITLSAGNHTLTPQWAGKTVTVRFNANAGSDAVSGIPGNQSFTYGTNGTLSWNTPTRTGYHLNGGSDNKFWNTAANGSGIRYNPGQSTYMYQSWAQIIGDKDGQTLDLYAQWAVNHYTVYYNLNGGSGDSSSQYVAYTDSFTTHSAPTRTGYIFEGWHLGSVNGTRYSANQGGINRLTANDGGSVTLYAKWTPITYTVNFNNNSDTHIRYNNNTGSYQSVTRSTETNQAVSGSTSSKTFTYDQSSTLTTNGASWAGHTFLGWSENKYATSATYGNGASIKNLRNTQGATVTLYAIWRADTYSLTVNPVNGSGTWNSSSSSQKGQADGYGDGKGNTKWGDKIILGNATAANKSATITYNVQADDAVIDRTSDTVKWVFSKWDVSSGSKGIIYNNSARANDGSHDNGKQTYYIIQNSNDTVTATYYWQTVKLPSPTREGYTFLGWYYDAECTDKVDGRGKGNTKYPLNTLGQERTSEFQTTGNAGATFRTEGNVTLYARWQKNSYSYADTEYVFMQNDDNNDTGVYLRKIDMNTLEPLVSSNGQGFTLNVYAGSKSSANLVCKLITNKGLYNKSGTKVANVTSDTNGWYNITSLIKSVSNYANTTFIVEEVDAPSGWSSSNDVTFTYKNKFTQVTVEDSSGYVLNEGYFTKVDIYGRVVANATFQLVDKASPSTVLWKGTTNERGSFDYEYNNDTGEFDKTFYSYCKAGHTYLLSEVNAAYGFQIGDPIEFTIPSTGSWTQNDIIYYEKPSTTGKLKLVKENADGEALEGAQFQLFMKNADGDLVPCYMNPTTKAWVNATEESDSATLMIGTTDANGEVVFNNLPIAASYTGSEPDYTKHYYVKEIQAPEGYTLMTEIMDILLPSDGNGKDFTYTITDDTITLTLEAGGNGMAMYYYVGVSSIIVAFALMLSIKNRKQNA